MYGIVWRYLPRGSWRLDEKVYDDKEKADTRAHYLKGSDTHAHVVHLGDPEDWK